MHTQQSTCGKTATGLTPLIVPLCVTDCRNYYEGTEIHHVDARRTKFDVFAEAPRVHGTPHQSTSEGTYCTIFPNPPHGTMFPNPVSLQLVQLLQSHLIIGSASSSPVTTAGNQGVVPLTGPHYTVQTHPDAAPFIGTFSDTNHPGVAEESREREG